MGFRQALEKAAAWRWHDVPTDPDGNRIERGMLVASDGELWVVGYAQARSSIALRLDAAGRSRLLGKGRLRLAHVIGFKYPTIYR